jgi:hypothetical protein
MTSWEIFKFSVIVLLNSIDPRLSMFLKDAKIPIQSDSELREWYKSVSGILFSKLFTAMPTDLRLLLMHLPHWTCGDAGLVESNHLDFNKDLIETAHPYLVWAKLCERFEPKNVVEQQNLLKNFMDSQMEKSSSNNCLVETFQNFYTRLLAEKSRLKNLGEQISDGILRLVLIKGLPKSDILDRELGNWKTLPFNQLLDKLVEFFSEQDSKASRSREKPKTATPMVLPDGETNLLALSHASSNSKFVCSFCGRTGHTEDKCFRKKTCRLCGKLGHIDKFCPNSIEGCDYCGQTNHIISDCRIKVQADALKSRKAANIGTKPEFHCLVADQDQEEDEKMGNIFV